MKTKLKTDHALFQRLKDDPPPWWKNLTLDTELYIDIRKNNYLNVYHNGGSIMRLEGAKDYKAKIHVEYIPLNKTSDYLPFEFQDGNISLNESKIIDINNFKKESLERIKKRVRKFYPNDSEKGIQGQYVINAQNKSKSKNGFFIDTELQYDNKRIDMVWVDLGTKKIAFVELKTIGDERLYIDSNKRQEAIDKQLSKYYEFAREHKDTLIDYYNRIYCIKKNLGILPEFVKENSLEYYKLIEKPILLIGDCTQKWIDKNAKDLNNQLKDIAFGCLYHGRATYNFRIPYNTSRNCFRLDEA
ncbi:hypothetical protein KJ656_06700 [bacterium]|nr:hypothetical protein [bacterium]